LEIVIVVGVIALVILFFYSRTEEGQKPIIEKPVIEESRRSGSGLLLLFVSIALFVFGVFGFGVGGSIADTATSFLVIVIAIALLGLTMFVEKVMPRFGLILFLACIISVFFVVASIGGL